MRFLRFLWAHRPRFHGKRLFDVDSGKLAYLLLILTVLATNFRTMLDAIAPREDFVPMLTSEIILDEGVYGNIVVKQNGEGEISLLKVRQRGGGAWETVFVDEAGDIQKWTMIGPDFRRWDMEIHNASISGSSEGYRFTESSGKVWVLGPDFERANPKDEGQSTLTGKYMCRYNRHKHYFTEAFLEVDTTGNLRLWVPVPDSTNPLLAQR